MDAAAFFPVQSERTYAALKCNGGSVRYVVLRARKRRPQLWEMHAWLERPACAAR